MVDGRWKRVQQRKEEARRRDSLASNHSVTSAFKMTLPSRCTPYAVPTDTSDVDCDVRLPSVSVPSERDQVWGRKAVPNIRQNGQVRSYGLVPEAGAGGGNETLQTCGPCPSRKTFFLLFHLFRICVSSGLHAASSI